MASQGKKKPPQKGESEMARRFKSNPFVFIGTFFILIIVVVAFVFVTPAGAVFGGLMGGDLTFGYYDRVPISFVPGNFFAQHYDMMFRQWQAWMGGEFPPWLEHQLWRESFEAAAVHTAILRTMDRAGYTPPARVVDREVAALPMFQEDGRFSLALYRQLDENRRLTLWRQVQDEITRSRFRADLDGLLVPSAEGEFIGRMASTERSFDMAVFSVDAFPDSEHEVYVQENPDLFRSAHLSMVTIRGGEREVRRILASITEGEVTFEDAARLHSMDAFADRGGDMGSRMVHDLRLDIPEAAVLEAALSLSAGEYSDVMRTAGGWVFFRAEADVQDADLSDPIVMGRVRAYMRSFARGRMEDWAIAQAEEFGLLASEYGFEEASVQWAETRQEEVGRRSFGPVPINFGNIDLFETLAGHGIAEITDSATNMHFWTVAFSTPLDSPSQPIVQGGNVVVLFPTEETEADDTAIGSVAATYGFWLTNMTDQFLHQHIMNSPRLDNRFMETYFRVFRH